MLDKSLKLVLICAGLWMTGCTSDMEEKAIDTIRERCKCKVAYSKSVTASTAGSDKALVVILPASPYMDSLAAQEPASFSAFTIYNSLTPEERKSYSDIRVVVQQNQANAPIESGFVFDMPEMALVASKYHHFEQTIEYLKKHQYDTLLNQFNPTVGASIDKSHLTQFLDSLEISHGAIFDHYFRGVHFVDKTVNNQSIHLIAFKGVLMRNKKDHNFDVFVSQDPKDEQIYGVEFK